MAGKRNATSELNHDNWEEYEPEEAGTFKRASQDVLRGRVIKTAKRRNPISSDVSDFLKMYCFILVNLIFYCRTRTKQKMSSVALEDLVKQQQTKDHQLLLLS